MSKKNKSIFTIILFLLFSVSVFSSQAYAVYYENSFPYDKTGLTGGSFIECSSSVGDIVILLPQQYSDKSLTFTTTGNLYNVTANTISCAVFLNGGQYQARFSSFSTLEYRVSSSSYYEYVPIVTDEIYDTNVIFISESERANENYYFTKYEIALLSVNISILFFVFLGWFLWHRK